MDSKQVKASHLTLDGEVLPDEEAEKIAEAVGRYAFIDKAMRERCLGCGMRDYVNVSGKNETCMARCGLCGHSWNPQEQRSAQQDIERPSGPLEPFN